MKQKAWLSCFLVAVHRRNLLWDRWELQLHGGCELQYFQQSRWPNLTCFRVHRFWLFAKTVAKKSYCRACWHILSIQEANLIITPTGASASTRFHEAFPYAPCNSRHLLPYEALMLCSFEGHPAGDNLDHLDFCFSLGQSCFCVYYLLDDIIQYVGLLIEEQPGLHPI